MRFCYVGLRNISSFAVLSKANVFVDPKKVKLIGVRQKEKKKSNETRNSVFLKL